MIQTAAQALVTKNRLPGMVLTDHHFSLPLDHNQPNGQKIAVYAREVVAPQRENDNLPWLVFFQGGPGFPAPRPMTVHGWLARALENYRVLLLDQRGTGRSSPITFQTLAKFKSPSEQAAYLSHFRADSIIKDAEHIRENLVGKTEKWTGLGQSFGGFCLTTYLSIAPEGLQAAIITGGLPPLSASVDDIYRATYKRSIEQNKRYYRRYPNDVDRVREVVDYLKKHDVRMPAGGRLTPERFLQSGLAFGMTDGFELLHYRLEEAFVDGASGRELGYSFLQDMEYSQAFDTNPIYALLHEAIYCQGTSSNWSAARVLGEYPQFSTDRKDDPIFFTGEMVYPWMFESYPKLAPMKEAAEILAAKEDWPKIYDKEKLNSCEVPVVAAVYYDDMYVETSYSEDTAANIGNIRLWLTNELVHNAIRAEGYRVLDHLLKMLNGEL